MRHSVYGNCRTVSFGSWGNGTDFSVLRRLDTKLLFLIKRCPDTNPARDITAKRALQDRYFWRELVDSLFFNKVKV